MNRQAHHPGLLAAVGLYGALLLVGCADDQRPPAARLDSGRWLGRAHYENDDFKSAAAEFRECVALAPDSAADRFNLALTLMRATDYAESLQRLAEAEQRDPTLLSVPYLRGIIYKRLGDLEQAIANLGRVVEQDPTCLEAYDTLGTCYSSTKQYGLAIAMLKSAVELAPDHPGSHYQLLTAYRLTGDREGAERHLEIFERIKDTVDESKKTREALEHSRYSEILVVPPAGSDLPPAQSFGVRFVDVTAEAGFDSDPFEPQLALPAPLRFDRSEYTERAAVADYLPAIGGSLALDDADGDGDLDVYLVNCSKARASPSNRLYRNQGRLRFKNAAAEAGVLGTRFGMSAVFGDYDNDGQLDLYVVGYGPNVLYHNLGDGTYADVSAAAGVDEPQFGRQAVFVDYDHDNDLDLFVCNGLDLSEPPDSAEFLLPDDFFGQTNTLLRNNGDGTFTDQTDEAGLLTGLAQSRALVYADFEGDHDIDLFVANEAGPSSCFANQRLGRFVATDAFSPALEQGVRAVAEADFDRDGRPDLIVAVGNALVLYTGDGRGGFSGRSVPVPERFNSSLRGGVEGIGVFDHDNDSWPDLLLVGAAGGQVALLAGDPGGVFRDISAVTGLEAVTDRVTHALAGDLDGDGDEDLVLRSASRGPRILENRGGDQSWISVQLVGRKVNRDGRGATIEVAAGGHYQRKTVRSGRTPFGLGDLKAVDIVRVTWPNGVTQNVLQPALNSVLEIQETVKVTASCGFLWAFDGDQFELVNEILGIGPLGVPLAPGTYHQPDCTELTAIASRQLALQDGGYELRLTEDLREIMYLDAVELRVVDRPAGLEIIPNEMFTAPPFPADKFFAVGDHQPPVTAVDERGNDIRELILRHEQRCPTFDLTRYDGLAESHSVILDLGTDPGNGPITLYLDSWIYWPDSSVVTAVAQDRGYTFEPLSLAVRDPSGAWRTVLPSVGLPTSKGLVVPVDLTGRFPSADRQVRLSTNLCVYFDRIFVSRHDAAADCRVSVIGATGADLQFRGFSGRTRDRFGYERFRYSEVQPQGSWDPPHGRFTRYGDVAPLLTDPDDMYVILGPGDELSLRFEAHALPPLPQDWERSFVFYANGWVKDGDLNTALSETVEPLPFHGMSGYPYGPKERYPETPEHQRYLEIYNSRPAAVTVGTLGPNDH